PYCLHHPLPPSFPTRRSSDLFAWAAYVATHPDVQSSLISQQEARQLVNHDFAHYYKQAPAQDFAAKVWTNNALIAAAAVASGILDRKSTRLNSSHQIISYAVF